MSETNQGNLRDYLRVLRDSRWVIIAVTVLFAAIAAGNSLSQKPRYDATARVSFQEESRSNAVAGLAAVQSQTAAQLAAEGASTMVSDDVLQRVRGQLRTPNTIDQLRGMLTTSVDASSALVAVQATSGDKQFAAALANAVANGAVTLRKNTERKRFAVSADRVERQYETLRAQGTQGTGTDVALASLLDRISTLRTLSVNAAPARLADAASVPSAASSPKPLRTTVFAGLIGLLLSVGFAFIRRSLDRRLRDSKDIQETLHLPVVGSVRIEALGGAACVSNGRSPMTDQDVESFRILRTNIEFLDVDHPIKSILVTSPLPRGGQDDRGRLAGGRECLGGKAHAARRVRSTPPAPRRPPVGQAQPWAERLPGRQGTGRRRHAARDAGGAGGRAERLRW